MQLDPRLGGISKRSHFRALLRDLWTGLAQVALNFTFLAYQAWLMADAIIRTLVRLYVTRKNMLQWVTAAQSKHSVDLNLLNIYVRMIGGVLLALFAGAISVGRPSSFSAAFPFLVAWIAAPAVARLDKRFAEAPRDPASFPR